MNKIFSYLGLAVRANKTVLGTDAVIKNLNKRQTYLILVASDASEKTIDMVEHKAFFYQIPLIKKYSTDEISHAVGKDNLKVMGINDQAFAKMIISELERIGD